MNLTCPCCRRTLSDGFSQGEAHIIEALANAKQPLTSHEIVAGGPIDILSFPSILTKLKSKLAQQGYRITNVTVKKGAERGTRARYRLEKTEG